MLFTALVLVPVDGEHDSLQERVDLGHGHQPRQVRNVSRLGLQQEQQVSISLRLLVVWKDTFLYIGRVFQVACDLVLLQSVSGLLVVVQRQRCLSHLLKRHAVLN